MLPPKNLDPGLTAPCPPCRSCLPCHHRLPPCRSLLSRSRSAPAAAAAAPAAAPSPPSLPLQSAGLIVIVRPACPPWKGGGAGCGRRGGVGVRMSTRGDWGRWLWFQYCTARVSRHAGRRAGTHLPRDLMHHGAGICSKCMGHREVRESVDRLGRASAGCNGAITPALPRGRREPAELLPRAAHKSSTPSSSRTQSTCALSFLERPPRSPRAWCTR